MVLGVEMMVVGWWTGGRFGFYNFFGRFGYCDLFRYQETIRKLNEKKGEILFDLWYVYLEFVIVIKIYDLLLKILWN